MLPTRIIFLILVAASRAFAVTDEDIVQERANDSPFVEGQVLVKVNDLQAEFSELESQIGLKAITTFALVPGLRLYQFDPAHDVLDIVRSLQEHATVVYAEPNFIYRAAIPKASVNDPEFGRQWALENNGQTGGKVDADINAPLMWNTQKGSRAIVVGIIDTGVDYNHPDLAGNIWNNPGEISGNGRDDDLNGYIDDIHGINAIRNNGNPMDDNVHGTHVAGTIGAVGNNSLGVVGVAQQVTIIGCKFLSGGGSGSAADALKCMDYFAALRSRVNNPVNLVATNNSWGGGGSSQSMLDAIRAHERKGILFIAAAGNESSNNDVTDSFPANYRVSNMISVAATDHKDLLASFSNYGKQTVHVAAPGVKILSTVLAGKYGELSGTSMATPHVTGLAAVIASDNRDLDYVGIKNLILAGAQPIPAATNTTISGRRIRGAGPNGTGSLTCENQFLVQRLEPKSSSVRIPIGQQVFLEATSINCAQSGGSLTVYQNGNIQIVLRDDGQNGDRTAGDGIVATTFQPTAVGTYTLQFSATDVVTVTVYDGEESRSYVANDVPYNYVSIGGQRLHAGDDTMHLVQAPFPIHFGGVNNSFTELFVSSNGTISFTDRSQPGFLNQALPTSVVNSLVAPYWDDFIAVEADADIYVEVTGVAPHRQFIVEWWKMRHFRTTGLATFQVVFYEDSADIRFNFADTNLSSTSYNSGASATVGVQISQESATQYSFNQPRVPSPKSIRFSL